MLSHAELASQREEAQQYAFVVSDARVKAASAYHLLVAWAVALAAAAPPRQAAWAVCCAAASTFPRPYSSSCRALFEALSNWFE